MQPDRLFTAGDILLVRVSSRQKSTLPLPPDLAPDSEGVDRRRRRFLQDVTSDAALLEALFLSSPPLVAELRKAAAGDHEDPTTVDQLVRSVSRYLVRMRSRATPFGLMAGVALGRAREQTKLRVGQAHTKTVRPDGAWLAAVIRDCERSPELTPSLRVWVHPMCRRRGSRLILSDLPSYYGPSQDSGQQHREGSVRLTTLVAHVVARCAQPSSLELLVRELHDALPTVPVQGIWAAVRTLLANGFLVSELWTAPQDADPLGRLLELTRTTTAPVTDRLLAARSALTGYARAEIGDGIEELADADATLRSVISDPSASTVAGTVQVDLNLDVELQLARGVLRQVERAATALQRMSSPRADITQLVDYQRDFVERYGLMNPVPVLDVVDPDRGIGPPAGYQRPPGHRAVRSPSPRPTSATARLAEAAQSALLSGANEMELTEELIEALDGEPEAPVWPSVELTVKIHAAAVESIDSGDYYLSLVPEGSASNAGRMFGRFLGGLGATDKLRNALLRHQATHGPEPVQVDYRPPYARNFNVTHTPTLSGRHLSFDGFPVGKQPADRQDVIGYDINDIAIYASRDGLHAVNVNDGLELHVTAMHMLNPEAAPNVVRLLEDIEALNSRPLTTWSWGLLGVWPWLPRVRYGRTVLYPARWRPVGLTGKPPTDESGWAERVARWQRELRVPDRIVAVSIGQRLALDLTRPGDRQLLRAELVRRSETLLFEDLTATLGGADWLDGRDHEITVPLFALAERRRAPQPRVRTRDTRVRPTAPDEPAPVHFPGEDWAYFRLYLAESGSDAFLMESLRELVQDVLQGRRWFYIRYNQPEFHVRFRVQSDRAALDSGVLADVAGWARRERRHGSLRELDLATYAPETWRYGHGRTMYAAEEVFWRDSQAALAQLSGRIAGKLQISTQELAAINYVQILRSMGLPKWMELVRDSIGRGRPVGVTREQRHRLRELADLSGSWKRLSSSAAGEALISSWEERSAAVSEYARLLRQESAGDPEAMVTAALSLLHMHFNRTCGMNHTKERQSLSLVRELLQGHLARLERS